MTKIINKQNIESLCLLKLCKIFGSIEKHMKAIFTIFSAFVVGVISPSGTFLPKNTSTAFMILMPPRLYCFQRVHTPGWTFTQYLIIKCFFLGLLCNLYTSRKPLRHLLATRVPSCEEHGLLMSRPAKSPGRSCPTPSNRYEMN